MVQVVIAVFFKWNPIPSHTCRQTFSGKFIHILCVFSLSEFEPIHIVELIIWLWLIRTFRRFSSTEPYFKQDVPDYCAEESRRIQCTKCGNAHIWVCTKRSKAKARWCQVSLSDSAFQYFLLLYFLYKLEWFWLQDCCQYHQAKDGDGWVEYRGSLVFDRPQKVHSFKEKHLYQFIYLFKVQA